MICSFLESLVPSSFNSIVFYFCGEKARFLGLLFCSAKTEFG